MKKILIGLLTLISISSFAEGVSSCSKDKQTSKRIEAEVPVKERRSIYNEKKELVGVLQVAGSDLVALYLCGNNSSYYYAEGTFESLLNGDSSVNIYNDEHSIEIKHTTLNTSYVVLEVYVSGGGDLDYEDFKTTLLLKL